jgi:competence protein ComEC
MTADLRLAGVAIGCWLSALFALHLSARAGWLLAVVGGVVAVGLMLLGRRLGRLARPGHPRGPLRRWVAVATVLASAALGVVCGASATAGRVGERDEEPLAALVRSRATVEVGFVVSDDPHTAGGAVGRSVTYVVAGHLTWLRRRPTAAERIELSARVLILAGNDAWRTLLPGQSVVTTGRLDRSRGGDLRAAVLSVNTAPSHVGVAPLVQRAAGALRTGLQRACTDLPPRPGGLLPGLVVGDVSRLDPGLHDDFQTTGLTHLTAVSGANCAILVGMVLLVARWCRAGPRLTAALSAIALVGFVVLARPSPSVLRAAAMGGLALIALATGRPRAAVPALAAGVVVLVVFDPELATDAGFALSVLATAGLMLLAPGWAAALRAHGVPAGVAEALAVPAAAQAACAPVIAAISASVSLTAIPANLLAAPAVAPATILGVFAAVLSPVWATGAAYAAWLASWPARWLVLIAHEGAQVPDGLVPWPSGAFGGLLLAGLLVALLVAFRYPVVRRLVLIVSVATVVGAVPIRVATGGWPPAGWFFVACDVGQGDAVVLAAGTNAAVVIDAGPDPDAVDRCLRGLTVDAVSLLVISHFHVDHVGGLEGVYRGRAVARIVTSPYGEPATGRAGVLASAAKHETPVASASPGDFFAVGPVGLTVLGPVERLTGTRSDPNNNSLVIRATDHGRSVLLTGDAEDEEQRSLLAALGPSAFRAEVLKVAHHGSAYQDQAFVEAVGAGVGLVSVGANNDYGHPSPVLIAWLGRQGMRVLRTDLNGDLAVTDRDGRLAVVPHGGSNG